MDRVKVPSGSIQKLETIFDDLQTLVQGNLNKRIDAITGTTGVFNALKNSNQVATSTGLKVAVTNIGTQAMTLQPGVAIVENDSIILVETSAQFYLANIYSGTLAANTYYQIHLRWKEVGTDPIISQNAFYFDKAGLTPYAQRFSRWSDSYQIVAYIRVPDVALAIPDNEIPLAIVKTATVATQLTHQSFTFSDIEELRTSENNIIDIRKDYTYRLNHDVLDDSLIVFKDRDSIGSNKVAGSLETDALLSSALTVSGLSTMSTTNITGLLSVTSSTAGYLNLQGGNTYLTGIIFSDPVGQRGYSVFDLNHNYIIGFETALTFAGATSGQVPSASLVVSSSGKIGNYISPTTELDLKNFSNTADDTIIKLSHIPVTAAESTIFKFGVESTGTTEYGRGVIQPLTYSRPFEFLNLSGSYVFKIDNTNSKVYANALEVNNTSVFNTVTMNSALTTSLTATTATLTNATVTSMVLSGLSIYASDASGIDLPGTASSEFRVGVGSSEYPTGRLVVLEYPDVNTPRNFRIYDVSPTDDKIESNSYIHLKWNWDGLNGEKQSPDEVVLNATTTTGEALNLTEGAAIIRRFYFSSSGNIYSISSYDATTRTVTLAENYIAGDIISDTYPAKIIDPDVTYYTIRAIEQNLDDGSLTRRTKTVVLDFDNIALNPEHIFKLELNKKWSISIKAGNRDHASPYVTMLPGTYDPDHIIGGQAGASYQSPFYNKLPYIDGATTLSPPSLTLTATAYGFRLDIEGWESSARDTSPHEFEVAYTVLSGITWENSSYGSTKKSGATFVKTVNRTLQVSTNDSTTWTVGVRPVQNNQPVGIPLLGIVNSGGGGNVPNDSVVVGPFGFKIIVASGIMNPVEGNVYAISGINNELWGENTLDGSTIIIGTEEGNILNNTLRFEE